MPCRRAWPKLRSLLSQGRDVGGHQVGRAGQLEGDKADAFWQLPDGLRLPAQQVPVQIGAVLVAGDLAEVGQVWGLSVDDGIEVGAAGQHPIIVDGQVRVELELVMCWKRGWARRPHRRRQRRRKSVARAGSFRAGSRCCSASDRSRSAPAGNPRCGPGVPAAAPWPRRWPERAYR